MVKKRVAEAHTSEGDRAVGKSLEKKNRISLHRIRLEPEIEAICREVISRVDGIAQLVRITPERLEHLQKEVQRKVKKNTAPQLPDLSEVEINAQSAKIRHDWNSKSWEKNPPHGWAWREAGEKNGEKGEPKTDIVALVYEMRTNPGEHEIFIDREICAHPRGALALIKSMNKRHKALMAWDKRKKKITKK